jgi:hypothetical protein
MLTLDGISLPTHKLVCKQHDRGTIGCELALANHVHELDSGKHMASRPE